MSFKYDNLLEHLSGAPTWSRDDDVVSELSGCTGRLSRASQALLEPFTFITSNPGKEFRSRLIDAFNAWLKVPAEKVQVISKLVNMLHAASLMWDPFRIVFCETNLFLVGSTTSKMIHSYDADDQVSQHRLALEIPSAKIRPCLQLVAHKIYGIPQTINSANYVYFLAYQELFKLRHSDLSPDKDLDALVTSVCAADLPDTI